MCARSCEIVTVLLFGADADAGLVTRTAPEGINVLDREELLPNFESFEKWWTLAEKIDAWPADQQPPSAETQVRYVHPANLVA